MRAIADHAYHILIIVFVATTIVQAVVKIMSKLRKRKRGPVAPRESAADREKRMRGLRVKMCVWLGVSRGLDLAFLNAD